MSDTRDELVEAEGPDVETKDTPDLAKADLEDQLRSIRSAEQGKRDEPDSE